MYFVNKKPLFSSNRKPDRYDNMIKTAVIKRFEREIPSIVESLKKYNPIKIMLFGSLATGDVNAHSDIDLCIIKNTSERFMDRIGDALELVESSFPVEALVYTEEEFKRMHEEGNPLICRIVKEGKTLYEQER